MINVIRINQGISLNKYILLKVYKTFFAEHVQSLRVFSNPNLFRVMEIHISKVYICKIMFVCVKHCKLVIY